MNVNEEFLTDLFYYREQIGRPFKSHKVVAIVLHDFIKTKEQIDLSTEELFLIMRNNKWKSVKMEWIKTLIFTNKNFTYELTSQLIEIEILSKIN